MHKLAGMLVETGKAFVVPSAMMTQMREDSDIWSLPSLTILCLANTFGHRKGRDNMGMDMVMDRRWTWQSPNGQHHNQIDYILVSVCMRMCMCVCACMFVCVCVCLGVCVCVEGRGRGVLALGLGDRAENISPWKVAVISGLFIVLPI